MATKNPVKYVFVFGGVLSGLGKGIVASSLGFLLKSRGFKVTIVCHCSGPLKSEIEARRLSAETLEISSDIGRRGGLVSYCTDTSRSFRSIYQLLKKYHKKLK